MTVTDQPIATDLPCVCGCPKWDHKQGRAVCKQCTCQTYEPNPDAEVAKLRAQVEQLEQAVNVLTAERDDAVLRANDAANKTARLRLHVEHLERDKTHAEGQVDEAREQRTKAQAQLADCEAALVEANAARQLSNAEHLHQRLTAATLVIGRWQDWRYCPLCREITEVKGARHGCGRMVPVDVIIARRPKTTEE